MNLMRFRSFVIVAEEGNVGRAARRLRIAQPALTRQLQALERDVGARLLDRHARGVSLTAAGAAFLEHAHAALAQADAAFAAARGAASHAHNDVLRISPPDWPNRARLVAPAVRALCTSMPGVSVAYDVTPWMLHADALTRGVTDVGFGIAMHPAIYGPSIAAHRLLDEPAASAAIPETHPLARRATVRLAELRDIPLLVPPRDVAGILHDQMVATVRQGGYEPRVALAPPSFALTVQVIVAGGGWTIVTDAVGEEPPHGVAVRPIADARFMLGFFLLHRASDQRASLREFVRHAIADAITIAGRPSDQALLAAGVAERP